MDHSISSPISSRHCWTVQDIEGLVSHSQIVLFSKGSREEPSCGYCKQIMNYLSDIGLSYELVDISEDSTIQSALRSYSGQAEVPVIYANGQLVACSDPRQRIVDSASLRTQLQAALTAS